MAVTYLVEPVTTHTRADFMRLWAQYLEEIHTQGGLVLPTPENLQVFGDLLSSYVRGNLFGFGLLAHLPEEGRPPAGCLLLGENPGAGLPLRTTLGKTATLWGVYVHPTHRRNGVARQLQDYGRPLTKELGFQSVVSDLLDNPVAKANALNWGAQLSGARVLVRLT